MAKRKKKHNPSQENRRIRLLIDEGHNYLHANNPSKALTTLLKIAQGQQPSEIGQRLGQNGMFDDDFRHCCIVNETPAMFLQVVPDAGGRPIGYTVGGDASLCRLLEKLIEPIAEETLLTLRATRPPILITQVKPAPRINSSGMSKRKENSWITDLSCQAIQLLRAGKVGDSHNKLHEIIHLGDISEIGKSLGRGDGFDKDFERLRQESGVVAMFVRVSQKPEGVLLTTGGDSRLCDLFSPFVELINLRALIHEQTKSTDPAEATA